MDFFLYKDSASASIVGNGSASNICCASVVGIVVNENTSNAICVNKVVIIVTMLAILVQVKVVKIA